LVEQAEMSRCMQRIIHQLPENYRLVLLLHDVHGLTNLETAQVLGCSLNAAKIQLHRGRLKLKEALRQACEFSCDERGVFVCAPKTPPSPEIPKA
jgi:RNA polymerase sigma-70 factor (ECF subfamily)